MYKDLSGINKVLLLLNKHGDPSFTFQNLSSHNINNQFVIAPQGLNNRMYLKFAFEPSGPSDRSLSRFP